MQIRREHLRTVIPDFQKQWAHIKAMMPKRLTAAQLHRVEGQVWRHIQFRHSIGVYQ